MESLTAEQLAEIDALILAGSIIAGMRRIMESRGISLSDAKEFFKARYRQLRSERGVEFTCGDEEYWSCYGEDLFEAIAKGW